MVVMRPDTRSLPLKKRKYKQFYQRLYYMEKTCCILHTIGIQNHLDKNNLYRLIIIDKNHAFQRSIEL